MPKLFKKLRNILHTGRPYRYATFMSLERYRTPSKAVRSRWTTTGRTLWYSTSGSRPRISLQMGYADLCNATPVQMRVVIIPNCCNNFSRKHPLMGKDGKIHAGVHKLSKYLEATSKSNAPEGWHKVPYRSFGVTCEWGSHSSQLYGFLNSSVPVCRKIRSEKPDAPPPYLQVTKNTTFLTTHTKFLTSPWRKEASILVKPLSTSH